MRKGILKNTCVALFCMFAVWGPSLHADTFASNGQEHKALIALERQKKVDQLLLLLQKRLSFMHEVARTKWSQNIPIEDIPREQQILATIQERSKKYGLDERLVLKLFQTQFDAAKRIMNSDFALWRQQKQPPFENTLDLKSDIRFYIDRLNREILEALASAYCTGNAREISENVLSTPILQRDSDRIETSVWQFAVSPLVVVSN